MAALSGYVSEKVLSILDVIREFPSKSSTSSGFPAALVDTVITDLTISFSSLVDIGSTGPPEPPTWHRIEKDLYLHSITRRAWLQVAYTEEKNLSENDMVVMDIKISEESPSDTSWEKRPGGIWILRKNYTSDSRDAVTAVDVLFGTDAIDPRPHWTLLEKPLLLDTHTNTSVARLTVRRGLEKSQPDGPRTPLKVGKDGKFKIVQFSDTHMVTGVGVCTDAMDAEGQPLPESEADPLTVKFMGSVLDVENPDLVILAGDQLHHGILDSQSALFKVVAPIIERAIPFASVFGNHDDEGKYALSRTEQMSLLESLPYSLFQRGPEEVDGIGNYYIQLFSYTEEEFPVVTLFFLDSHGPLLKSVPFLGYDYIRRSQIDWFTNTSQTLRKEREKYESSRSFHVSMAFQHIPIPEYGARDLIIKGGHRGEPTEGPRFNSGFYDALVKEEVAVMGCGHDHVNDFCAQLPLRVSAESDKEDAKPPRLGPWLCYGGGGGFGGYGIYGKKRYYRRSRVWEFDTTLGRITTWKRVEYAKGKVDELILVDDGAVVTPV